MIKVFEGGTCNNSKWRDVLETKLDSACALNMIELFNPVVDDWNAEAQKREVLYKENCDFQLFVITPKMTGVFSIAEAIDCSNKNPEKCIFCILQEDEGDAFTDGQMKSLIQTSKMIINNGGHAYASIKSVADYLMTKSIVYK